MIFRERCNYKSTTLLMYRNLSKVCYETQRSDVHKKGIVLPMPFLPSYSMTLTLMPAP